MEIYKTFFKKEVFAEFVIPQKPSTKVAIVCSGAPSNASKREILKFFCKKGYWVFHFRYRGTWESRGIFLKRSPDEDIVDIISELPKGFKDLWSKKQFAIQPTKIVLLGMSFGGPAVILASKDERVNKVIAVSPVVDWKKDGKAERMIRWIPFMQEAYGMAYRTSRTNWNKLLTARFYNPAAEVKTINGSKLFILHAKDDDIVPFRPVRSFVVKTGAQFLLFNRGGHIRATIITKPAVWKKISKFLKSTTTHSRKNS